MFIKFFLRVAQEKGEKNHKCSNLGAALATHTLTLGGTRYPENIVLKYRVSVCSRYTADRPSPSLRQFLSIWAGEKFPTFKPELSRGMLKGRRKALCFASHYGCFQNTLSWRNFSRFSVKRLNRPDRTSRLNFPSTWREQWSRETRPTVFKFCFKFRPRQSYRYRKTYLI